MQRALYALVRESVYSGAHATHASRVELAYGGSHASGARDGVAEMQREKRSTLGDVT